MKIPYSWLKEYIDLDGLTIEDISKKLTLAGSEISSVETTGGDIPGVIIGMVVSIHKHPDADRLNVCKVDVGGDSHLSIVCGASNIAEDIYVPVATVGAKLPSGTTIRRTSIRGFESNGMICSRTDLGYEEIDSLLGIWILDKNIAKLGEPVSSIVGSIEYVLNVEVAANRGDMLSLIGFARECSLVLEKRLSIPSVEQYDSAGGNIDILVENSDICGKYAARLIRDVVVTQSPGWLQNRLRMCGITPINNIVDVTNYVMLEYGQPTHAFDFDKITSSKIIVRNAKEDERITLLDGREVALTEDVLVIADFVKPLSIAGVMGGLESAITSETKNVIIESAYFDSIAVRRASKITATKTDASYRFERGVDPSLNLAALNRAVELLITLNKNAKIASRAKEVNSRNIENRHIVFDCNLVKKYLGLTLNRMEIAAMLKRYGFSAATLGGNNLKVNLPGHRPDLSISVDLVEEIARVYGYDRLGKTVPRIKSNKIESNYEDMSRLKHLFSSYGLWEAKHLSMGSSELHSKLELDSETFIYIQNPIASDLDILRPTAFASVMESVLYNQNHRNKSGAIFELGNIFYKVEPGLPAWGNVVEQKRLSAAMFGFAVDKTWNSPSRPYDFFDLSGVLEQVLKRDLRCEDYAIIPTPHKWFVPTQSAVVSIFGEAVGFIGRVHPNVLSIFDISGSVFYLDIDAIKIISLCNTKSVSPSFKDIGRYPAVFRDMSLICDRDIPFDGVMRFIESFDDTIRQISVVDRYVGVQIPDNKVSVSVSVTYFDPERTLREEQINKIESALIDSLKENFLISLRRI